MLIIPLVDGLRIDSVFNVDPDFLSGFNNAANVFCIGEGSTENVTAACSLQGQLDGMLNYPLCVSSFGVDKSTIKLTLVKGTTHLPMPSTAPTAV
jgi:hypothetical protein